MSSEPISDEDLDWLRGNLDVAQGGLGNDFLLQLIARIDAAHEADANVAESLIGRRGWTANEALGAAAAAIRRGGPPIRTD